MYQSIEKISKKTKQNNEEENLTKIDENEKKDVKK